MDNGAIQNLAEGKAAYQSGTLSRQVAKFSVDGTTTGTFSQSSCTVRGGENWWEVDLGSVGHIDNIQIYNRTDTPAATWLSNYHVFISDVRFTGTTVAASQAQSGVGAYHQTTQAGSPTTISNVNRTGRYIRVQSTATNSYLSMLEVKVNGTYSTDDAPTVEAGENQTVNEGDAVTLAGSGSDPEGATATYSWRQTAGSPNVTLTGASTKTASFTAPELLADVDLTFELTVSDGSLTATDAVTITIEADNDAPTADAGNNQTVNEGDAVTLSGSGTDPEAQTLTYSWRQTSGTTVSLSSTSAAAPTFTAPNRLANETLIFELTVSDGSLTGTDTVTITVGADNDAPTAEAGNNQTVNEGDAVTLSGSGTDPEQQTLTYSWRQTAGSPNVSLTNATTQTASFTAPNVAENTTITLTFELTVSDGSLSATDTVIITIEDVDTTPDAFSFTAETGVEPGAVVTSNTITVSGLNTAAAISDGKAIQLKGVTNKGRLALLVAVV